MAKKPTRNPDKIKLTLELLKSFVNEFDDQNAEDAQIRVDLIIAGLLSSGLVDHPKPSTAKFHAVIDLLDIQPKSAREKLRSQVEEFMGLISSYGDDPFQADLQEAEQLLIEIEATLRAFLEQQLGEA